VRRQKKIDKNFVCTVHRAERLRSFMDSIKVSNPSSRPQIPARCSFPRVQLVVRNSPCYSASGFNNVAMNIEGEG
jgi:hypothetical protein